MNPNQALPSSVVEDEDSPTLEQQMEDIRASMEGCSDSEWANLLETLVRNASRTIAGMAGQMVISTDLYEELVEFLEDQQDADCRGDPPQYIPNRAMSLLIRLTDRCRST